jgi:hypothetical protein
MIGDMASVAANWFRKSPKQMAASLSVTDRDGKPRTVPLSGQMLAGAW